ncbi:uncharacterized protein LOC113557145 [Rhopalosiphum maidis]|uniref:uncharacterized protein LOC113557145 n=1 Tax=Rhopalosiphum maidis TaxID=43146 RepID=UPI000EFEC5F2|nr:uncharacterized protein LOC113557145 [Rhopalosiphum maidis]
MKKTEVSNGYQELQLVKIRECELPVLKRAVLIYVPAKIKKNENMVQQGLEVFSRNMNTENNTELSETKRSHHQNTFQDMAKGQVVNSKSQPLKNKLFNNIETTPIELDKKCISKNKESPTTITFLEELKEQVSKLFHRNLNVCNST